MYNPYSLQGKTILITGASSGIGKTTAIECSKLGATLIITGRNIERLQETQSLLEGTNHLIFNIEMTNESQLEELVDKVPALDGVFLCAGVSDTTLVKFITKEKIDRVFNINFVAPTILLKLLLKKKKINHGASLVWMSSYGAEQVQPGLGIYAASKAAVNGIMRTFAKELLNRQIRSNSIMPMMIKTELLNTLGSISSEEWSALENQYPLGFGSPLDVAFVAIFLLSDASKWITGSEVRMDGGSTL